MKYLFLDNFRGFANTTVPLADVNFLVGENSTGKTSFLTMLRMFSGSNLFMGQEAGEEIHLGHFSEMVSAHSADRSYFHLGIADEHGQGEKRRGFGMLLTYKPVHDLSQIARITCTLAGVEVSMYFQDGKVFSQTNKVSVPSDATEMNHRLLEWVKEHNRPVPKWKQIKLPDGVEANQFPMFMLLALATRDLTSSKDSKVKGPKTQTSKAKDPKAKDTEQEFHFSLPSTLPPVVWIAPIRAKPKRTYDEAQTAFSPEGAHIPYVIKKMLGSKKEAEKFTEFIKRIGAASGLFQKIEVKYFAQSATGPFEVDAYLDDAALSVGWLGYGVSQSLPIFVELLDRPVGSWFAIQQPEVHLHPRAQASLGDVFFEMALRDRKRFIIETHSDFAIDRFRLNYRTKRSKQEREKLPKGQILFFERRNKQNVVTPLPIGDQGQLPANQPENYRRFFIKEEMRLLGSR